MTQNEQDILIGKIVAPFGIKGEVKVIVLTEFPERFEAGKEIELKLTAELRKRYLIESSRSYKDGVVIKLRGIETRNDAEELRNVEVVIGRGDLGELPGDSYYIFEIIGLRVLTDDGRELGRVTEILQGGSNDVYVTSENICIPALKSVVSRVDVQAGEIIVRPVPGLLPDDK